MAPKRTIPTEAENSPEHKKRVRAAPNSTRKQARDETEVPAKKSSKGKKKAEGSEEAGASPEQAQQQGDGTSPPVQKKRGRKSNSTAPASEEPVVPSSSTEIAVKEESVVAVATVAVTSPAPVKSKTPSRKAATPAAAASAQSTPLPLVAVATERVTTPMANHQTLVVPSLPTVSAPVVAQTPAPETSQAVEVLRAPPSADPLKSYESEGLADEGEIMNVWNQTWRALTFCSEAVVPFFLGLTLYYYSLGKYTGSQSVAAVGIVFASFLVLIMGSYILAVLPFILLSRMLTCVVSDTPLTVEEQRETNLYARMFLFFTLLAGIALVVTHA